MTTVINMKHDRELRRALDREPRQGDVVRIDRRTEWGNPFRIGEHGDRARVIERYRAELWRRIRAGELPIDRLATLSGKTPACWCSPEPCHGDVLGRAADWAAHRLAQSPKAEPKGA